MLDLNVCYFKGNIIKGKAQQPSDINLCVSFHGSGLSFETLTSSLHLLFIYCTTSNRLKGLICKYIKQ